MPAKRKSLFDETVQKPKNMRYTRNIHNKLLQEGFKFDYEHVSEPGEDPLFYTVYRKGAISVTVCDSHRETTIDLEADLNLSGLSLAQLRKLDNLINK